MHEQDLARRSGLFYDPFGSAVGTAIAAPPAQSPKQERRARRPKSISRRDAAIAAVTNDLRMLISRVEAGRDDSVRGKLEGVE